MSEPLVSIITVVYNAEDSIEKAILSVIDQSYHPIEYIVINGASTDRTLEIINKYQNQIKTVLSEPDQGIYDAFNKGYSLSSGDYIGYLNADDWLSPDQIKNGVQLLLKTGADFSFGDMLVHSIPLPRGGKTLLRPGDPDYMSKINYSMPELHQTTWLCSAEMFKKTGLFDTRYRIAGDYDWILRAHNLGFVGAYSQDICGNMKYGGISMVRQELAIIEGFFVVIRNGGSWVSATRYWLPLMFRVIYNRLRVKIARFRKLNKIKFF